jgi:hypothetical protein
MAHWGDVASKRTREWYRVLNETGYEAEIAEYWRRVGKGERMEKVCADIGKRPWN